MATSDNKDRSALTRVEVEDCLDQDPEIRGQKWVCLSFISPEDVIRNKEIFFFSRFLKHFSDDILSMFGNLRAKFEGDKEVQDMISNVLERHAYVQNDAQLEKEYNYFKEVNADQLESVYYEKNNFQTSIRGIKVRGVYESDAEARLRAKAIKKFDKYFDVFIGQVGCWCPWSPDPSAIAEQEWPEDQLNTLMKKYKENQDNKDQIYSVRKEYLIEQTGGRNKDSLGDEITPSTALVGSDAHGAGQSQAHAVVDIGNDADPWLQQKEKIVATE